MHSATSCTASAVSSSVTIREQRPGFGQRCYLPPSAGRSSIPSSWISTTTRFTTSSCGWPGGSSACRADGSEPSTGLLQIDVKVTDLGAGIELEHGQRIHDTDATAEVVALLDLVVDEVGQLGHAQEARLERVDPRRPPGQHLGVLLPILDFSKYTDPLEFVECDELRERCPILSRTDTGYEARHGFRIAENRAGERPGVAYQVGLAQRRGPRGRMCGRSSVVRI